MTLRLAFLTAATTIVTLQAHGATTSGFTCLDLRKAAQRLQVHATNIANANTTRTPEGGPFKIVELKCREMFCESVLRDDFRLVYDPSHPDANKAGYVQLPNVDLAREIAAVNSAATEVKLLATTGVCGASALTTPTNSLVKYDAGASILTDVLGFSADGKLTSWSRTTREGKQDHVAFAADGTIAKAPVIGTPIAPAPSSSAPTTAPAVSNQPTAVITN